MNLIIKQANVKYYLDISRKYIICLCVLFGYLTIVRLSMVRLYQTYLIVNYRPITIGSHTKYTYWEPYNNCANSHLIFNLLRWVFGRSRSTILTRKYLYFLMVRVCAVVIRFSVWQIENVYILFFECSLYIIKLDVI
jgi:hypothetical protein